jgi:Amt family ammonium transporter
LAEIIGVGANIIYVGIISYIVFKLIDLVIGNRVSPETEIAGLDIPEMGVSGYSGVRLDPHSETPFSRE